MKTLFLSLLISFFQGDFKKVDKLIEDRQYSDAFKLLNEIDPENENPQALTRKIDICLDNYIMSIGHKMFALKNLKPGEKLKALRGNDGVYDMYQLDVEALAQPLMEKYPNNYELKFAVGKYYHSMHLNCGDCSISAADCMQEFETLFEECYQNDVYDYFSLYGIGYVKINNQQLAESIPYFLKSIELNDEYPTSHYNLSYAYLFLQDYESSIKYAKNAYERYDPPHFKADGAKIVASAYTSLKKFDSSYLYYSIANETYPNDYYTLEPLLNVSLYLKKDDSESLRDALFQLDTDNPTIYQDLINAYYDFADIKELLAYFESLKPTYKDDYATLGSLHFYTGKINLEEGNTAKGKELLALAKKELSKVYPADHQVFPVIDQLLEKK